jgi:hypothetical protein
MLNIPTPEEALYTKVIFKGHKKEKQTTEDFGTDLQDENTNYIAPHQPLK